MKGARWHGFVEGDKRKIWSVDDCQRNRFQIDWLSGGNPYEWFDRPVIEHDFPEFGSPDFGYLPLMSQQRHMANTALTYHFQIWGAEMGTGKTLAAIAVMLMSGLKDWWWIGPKSSIYGIRQEFDKWGLPEGIVSNLMHYEKMMQKMREWRKGDPAPMGVIFDESQKLKTETAQRTQCAQKLADSIRDEHGKEGYVICMTGTPSPKSPVDWWAPCEIAYPGFVKEGETSSFEKRLGFYRLRDDLAGQAFPQRIAWRDDSLRCKHCGYHEMDGHHMMADGEIIEEDTTFDTHVWEPSINEVKELYGRLDGLVTIVHKKDCLDLPDKVYKEIICEPSPSLLRVAGALTKTAPNVITGLTLLRELSDGFQYREVEDGYQTCPSCEDGTETVFITEDGATIHETDMLSAEFTDGLEEVTRPCVNCKGSQKIAKYKRITREVACPKEQAVADLLEQNEDQGRTVFFAGFTGSLDRITKICQREGWDTVRVDGRGWRIERLLGEPNEDGSPKVEIIKLDNPLDYWIDSSNQRVAFVAHPKSGGVSLTLCPQQNRPGSTMCCFYSNDFDPGSRSQAEDRIHRTGMDENKGATIIDLFHLPTDRRVLDVLRQNRKLELMTMGDFEKELETSDV
jgi:SNF2 family DNA or RNA helicase